MVTEEFVPFQKQFRIIFFWEQMETTVGGESGYIVEAASAAPSTNNYERAGIDATHSRMVKLTKDHSSFPTVAEVLIRYCRSAPPAISYRWRQVISLLRSRPYIHDPAFYLADRVFDIHGAGHRETLGYQNKHYHIPQAVSSIFTGREDVSEAVEDALFSHKHTDSVPIQCRYIIHGIRESGKTQFACKFAQDHRDK